ncbi:hypothetical protein J2Z76_001945 [Sedimentibacter acidaminivorans]|uniref:Anti-sigma-W factor RsiW n=1 Tax=Sedimentibacter acidaminivorans TaxID=913099 RepID=A0ABS4GEF7_9FIRM|nr:DUF4349 domain-containing protein [Sedimentibacter acidaminivorans]MBP1926081.1 hypothetical protein [Sedimentibacter acidaminivorans]
MNCNEIKDMLSLYIDGELDENEKKTVEEHVGICESCRNELEQYQKIINVLQNLIEEEPPKGYCKRLHEKLLKAKQQKKISARSKWVKYGSIAAAFVLVVSVIYVSSNLRMGSSVKNENSVAYDRDMQATESPAAPSEGAEMYGLGTNDSKIEEQESASGGNNTLMKASLSIEEERKIKIIKSGKITTQTEGYDLFINNLISKVEGLGGYIEQNNTDVNNWYGDRDKKIKSGYLKLRVPDEYFEELVIYLETESDVYQKNVTSTDMTKEYYEKDNRVKNLELQETHLRELFANAKTVEETLLIENELRRVRTEIDALNINLSDIDDRASMSTISLEVQEVLKANLSMSDRDNVWERAKEGFVNTINGIVDVTENIIISLISVTPILVPALIILVIVWIKLRKNKTKS